MDDWGDPYDLGNSHMLLLLWVLQVQGIFAALALDSGSKIQMVVKATNSYGPADQL